MQQGRSQSAAAPPSEGSVDCNQWFGTVSARHAVQDDMEGLKRQACMRTTSWQHNQHQAYNSMH